MNSWDDCWYDVAQVCPNGHVVNWATIESPTHNKKYCEKCGEPTLSSCPSCHMSIRGEYHVPRVISMGSYDLPPPAFCHNCGKAFPWTERKQQAAIDLFIEETQDQEEQREFRESVEQITKDTPQANVASKRIMRLLGKVGKGTASAIRDILVNLASEGAKKILMGP
jgi:hypothetical protein